MADRKISDLTALTAPAAGDYLPIVDISEVAAASKNKRITIEELFRGVPLGTAAAPSIAIEGDENTGIYSPGADQVAISTGGTGRLFIDSSGRLLAGTSTARTNFFGTTLSAVIQTEGTGGSTGRGALSVINNDVSNNPPYVLLGRSGAATLGSNAVVVSGSRLGTLTFHGADGTSFIEAATVAGEVDGTPGTNDMPGRLVFSTTADGAASPSERLRITSAGQIQSAGLGSAASPVLSFSGDPNTGIYSPGADQLAVATNGTGRLFVTSLGRVGVNTDSPGFIFQIEHTTQDGIRLRTANTSDSHIDFADADANGRGRINYDHATDSMGFRTAGAERLRITSAGLVGVGTSSVSTILHVNAGAAADTNVRLQIGAAGNHAKHTYSDATNTVQWTSGWRSSTNTFGINVGDSFNSTGLTIDSSGRVGIGTTPGQILDIQASGTAIARIKGGSGSGQGASFFVTQAGSASTLAAFGDRATAFGGTVDQAVSIFTGTSIPLTFDVGGTEKARIDSSGRLLVGTSSARANFFNVASGTGATLQIEGTSYQTSSLALINNEASTSSNALVLAKSRGTSVGSNTILNSGDIVGTLSYQGNDGSEFVEAARIDAVVDGTPGANDMPGRLVFSTTADGAASPTEAMRINSAGQIGLGDTNPAAAAERVSIFSKTLAGVEYCSLSTVTTASTAYHHRFVNTNGVVGSISTTAVATLYSTSSDYRLKENVTPVLDGIARFKQLKPSRFNFIADPDKTVDGFLAHEVQEVVPEAIIGEKDKVDDDGNPVYQGIDQSKLVPLLTAALQEAIGEIESLKARVAALEAQ